MKLVTWNVLHRIHAENWNEREVLERFPDEPVRIAAVVDRVAGWAAGPEPVCVCLQEVAGDLLAALRRRLPEVSIHSFRYPRTPRPKHGGAPPLADPSEHLAILLRGLPAAVPAAAEAFAEDPGKGFLGLRLGDWLVVNTHVSFGRRGEAEVARLARFVADRPAVLCGDFNRSARRLLEGLGEDFGEAVAPPGAVPAAGRAGIDHVILRGLRGRLLPSEPPAPESDHQPVAAWLDGIGREAVLAV